MELILAGLSHKTAPIELRERFAIPKEEIPRALTGLLADFGLKEAVILSTCNRVEVCAVSSHLNPSDDVLDEFFIYGSWGYVLEKEITLQRDIRGLVIAAYQLGQQRQKGK